MPENTKRIMSYQIHLQISAFQNTISRAPLGNLPFFQTPPVTFCPDDSIRQMLHQAVEEDAGHEQPAEIPHSTQSKLLPPS